MGKPRKYDPTLSGVFDEQEAGARAAIDALDRKALAIEQAHGWVDAILVKVPPEEAARFQRARIRLDEAIEAKEWQRVTPLAGALARGYDHLASLLPGTGDWAMRVTVEGKRYRVVSKTLDIHGQEPAHGEAIVSLEELIRVYEAAEQGLLSRIKSAFPQAAVEAVERKPQPDWRQGDELPF